MGAGKDSERYLITITPREPASTPTPFLVPQGPLRPCLSPPSTSREPRDLILHPRGTPKKTQNSLPHCCTPPPPQEFEVIAQIKLLQSACNNYSIEPEEAFSTWFRTMERLSEAEG